jgi:DNA polymerase III subunit delta
LKLTLESLSAHLVAEPKRAYLVSGDESLLVAESTDAIRARARKAGFEEREVHFIERVGDWTDVLAEANNLSLFGSRKVLELRLPSGKPGVGGSNAIVELLESPNPDNLILMTTGKLDRDAQNSNWVKAFEKHGVWLPIWPVESARLPVWLATRARSAGLQLAEDAAAFIADRCEGNLLAAHQEIEKLRLLAPAGPVTLEAVRAAVADSARYDVFQLGEAALAGDVARAWRILAGLRGEGVEPTLALWSLAREVKSLWGTTQPDAGAGRGWYRPTAALERGKRRAAKLPYARLGERVTRVDRMIKGLLPGDPWDEMQLLVAEFGGIRTLPIVSARYAS